MKTSLLVRESENYTLRFSARHTERSAIRNEESAFFRDFAGPNLPDMETGKTGRSPEVIDYRKTATARARFLDMKKIDRDRLHLRLKIARVKAILDREIVKAERETVKRERKEKVLTISKEQHDSDLMTNYILSSQVVNLDKWCGDDKFYRTEQY